MTLENSLLLVERCKKFNKDLLIRFDSNFKKNHHQAIMTAYVKEKGENEFNRQEALAAMRRAGR